MIYAALALVALLAPAEAGRKVTLALPRPLRADETVWIEVKVGVIERGADVTLLTEGGDLFGVISPFAIKIGHVAGTYTMPVPAAAISKHRVVFRMVYNDYQRPKRAPTLEEVPRIQVRIISAP